jgi:hypothetical protein
MLRKCVSDVDVDSSRSSIDQNGKDINAEKVHSQLVRCFDRVSMSTT